MGVHFFWAFFFFLFLFLLHLVRGCSKKPIFIGFLHTPLKHLVTSCSNKEVKPKLPKKRCTFFRKPLFWPKTTFKNTNFAPPPENCAPKISQNPYFYRLKKGGQVIDPTVAKLLTLKWPKCGQVIDPTAYVYIYMLAVRLGSGPTIFGILMVMFSPNFLFFWSQTPGRSFFVCLLECQKS